MLSSICAKFKQNDNLSDVSIFRMVWFVYTRYKWITVKTCNSIEYSVSLLHGANQLIHFHDYFKEALYDVIMADFHSKSHFWSEMIPFFYKKKFHYTPLIENLLMNFLNHQNTWWHAKFTFYFNSLLTLIISYFSRERLNEQWWLFEIKTCLF